MSFLPLLCFELKTQAACVIVGRLYLTKGKGKGKGHPITSPEGPDLEWWYSFTLSVTSVLYGDEWSKPRPGRFTPGKDPVSIL
jgi:hypothetical protein